MFSLVSLAFLATMIGVAFPPVLIFAAALWFLIYRKASRNVARVRDRRIAKATKFQQSTHDKAMRFFQ